MGSGRWVSEQEWDANDVGFGYETPRLQSDGTIPTQGLIPQLKAENSALRSEVKILEATVRQQQNYHNEIGQKLVQQDSLIESLNVQIRQLKMELSLAQNRWITLDDTEIDDKIQPTIEVRVIKL